MTTPLRPILCALVTASLAFGLVALPGSPAGSPSTAAAATAAAAPAADPTPSAPRTVVFVAGTHTAYRFDSTGAILATRTASFTRPSSAPATARSTIPGRGYHLSISAGVFAGYWVRESTIAYVQGIVADRSFATTAVSFPAGTYLGYRFTTSWNLDTAKPAKLVRASMAHANRSAVINGRPYVAIVDGIWAGYWMPGTVGGPTAIACRAGNRVAPGSAQVIRSVSTSAPRMSLTFDMGGRLDPALSILSVLLVDRTCATIFVTGDAANTTLGTTVLSLVRAHPELFEVGNHTMHHCDLVSGGGASTRHCPATRPSAAFVQSELTSAGSIALAKTGQSPAPYWRPPYGSFDAAVGTAAAGAGYTKTFLWSVDTIDWKPIADGGPNALQVATKIRNGAAKGAIVLMHIGGYSTFDALPFALDGIRSKGLTPTSLSELLQ